MAKYKLHFPTEEFGFIESEELFSAEEALNEYKRVMALRSKVLYGKSSFLDYLTTLFNSDLTEWGDVDTYAARSQEEKDVVQAIKRYQKRRANNKQYEIV